MYDYTYSNCSTTCAAFCCHCHFAKCFLQRRNKWKRKCKCERRNFSLQLQLEYHSGTIYKQCYINGCRKLHRYGYGCEWLCNCEHRFHCTTVTGNSHCICR